MGSHASGIGRWKTWLYQIYKYAQWSDWDYRPLVWLLTNIGLLVVLMGPAILIAVLMVHHEASSWAEFFISGHVGARTIQAGVTAYPPQQAITVPIWVRGHEWTLTNPFWRTNGTYSWALVITLAGLLLCLIAFRVLYNFRHWSPMCTEFARRKSAEHGDDAPAGH